MSACNIARDLMPLSVDGALCADSQRALKSHLSRCECCRAYYRQIRHCHSPSSPDMSKESIATHEGYVTLAKKIKKSHVKNMLAGSSLLTASLLCNIALLLAALHSKQEKSQ